MDLRFCRAVDQIEGMLPNVERLAMCKDAPLFPPAGEYSDSQQWLIVLIRVPAAVDEVFAGLSDCIEGLSGVHGHWFPETVPLLFLDLFGDDILPVIGAISTTLHVIFTRRELQLDR